MTVHDVKHDYYKHAAFPAVRSAFREVTAIETKYYQLNTAVARFTQVYNSHCGQTQQQNNAADAAAAALLLGAGAVAIGAAGAAASSGGGGYYGGGGYNCHYDLSGNYRCH